MRIICISTLNGVYLMRNRCRCSNLFNDTNRANWIFPSRQEGNRLFARCKKCNLEWEVFTEPTKEGAPQKHWLDPDISLGNNKGK